MFDFASLETRETGGGGLEATGRLGLITFESCPPETDWVRFGDEERDSVDEVRVKKSLMGLVPGGGAAFFGFLFIAVEEKTRQL